MVSKSFSEPGATLKRFIAIYMPGLLIFGRGRTVPISARECKAWLTRPTRCEGKANGPAQPHLRDARHPLSDPAGRHGPREHARAGRRRVKCWRHGHPRRRLLRAEPAARLDTPHPRAD